MMPVKLQASSSIACKIIVNKMFTFLDFDDVPWNNNNVRSTP